MAFTEVSHYRVLANDLGSRENTDFFFFFQHPWEIFWVCSQGNDMHGLGHLYCLFTRHSRGHAGIACACKWPEEGCSSKQKLETGLPVRGPALGQACSLQALHSVLPYSLGPRDGFSLLLSN